MATRVFNLAALCSTTLLCLIIIGWFAAGEVDPRKQFVSLYSGCHLSIDARGADARLEVFNDATYGPYTGSLVGVVSKFTGLGDTAGVYYRHIRWPNGAVLWTLSLSLAYPLVLSAALPAMWVLRQQRQTRRGFSVESGGQ